MRIETLVPRTAIAPAALVVALAVAVPVGQILGDWVIFGTGDFASELARRRALIPAVSVLLVAGAALTRYARSRLWLAAPVLILAMIALGVGLAVGARVDAFRDGPLNAAL